MLKRFALVYLIKLSLCSLAFADISFPVPESIRGNVNFWTKVYGQWSKEEAAVFDREDLNTVYTVVSLPKSAAASFGVSQIAAVKAAMQEVKTILMKFDKEPPISDKNLVGLEKSVFHALELNNSPNKYARWENIGVMQGLKERFAEGYRLSGMHSAQMERQLMENNLPKELLGVVFVESLFYNHARSKAGAGGLWQLLRGTAKENIFVNGLVDERFDPVLATRAAIVYLKGAYQRFGSWPLAITSYNYGRAGIQRAINSGTVTNFDDLYTTFQGKRFGFAAKNYYAEFLAALEVYQNANSYFPEINKANPWSYDIYTLPHPVFFSSLQKVPGLKDYLMAFNPALTPEARKGKEVLPEGFKLRIPSGTQHLLTKRLKSLSQAERRRAEQKVRARHHANGRQNIFQIAKQHDISREFLAQRMGYALQKRPSRGTVIVLRSAGGEFSKLPTYPLVKENKTKDKVVAPVARSDK